MERGVNIVAYAALFLLCLCGITRASSDSVEPVLRQRPLEKDRQGPSPAISALNIPPVAGALDYFLYNYVRRDHPGTPIVHLRIPEEFSGLSDYKTRHVWGIHFSIWHPALISRESIGVLTGISPKCRIHPCSEEIAVSIDNRIGVNDRNINSQILKRDIQLSIKSPSSSVKYSKINSDSFDESYIKNSNILKSVFDEEYFVKYQSDGNDLLFVKCNPNKSFPACVAYFWLNDDDKIEIKLHFSRNLLSSIFEMHRLIDRLVGGLVAEIVLP